MGRGRGGYTAINEGHYYKDSGGYKVTDTGAIWVAERYIEAGYESVFRQRHSDTATKTLDLTIKDSSDENIIKNIEVKRVTGKTSQIVKNIKKANDQINIGDTIAIYLPNYKNDENGKSFAINGIMEAKRKCLIKGPIEIWFSDKTKIEF